MPLDRIPKGSLVLVTGVTGLCGSVVADHLLKHGFRVRGVGRSASKAAPLIEHSNRTYGKDTFEFAEVVNAAAPGAFTNALQGVAGVIHVAGDMSTEGNVDLDENLQTHAASMIGMMEAAANAGSVKAFIHTGAMLSAFVAQYGQDMQVSLDTFTEWIIPTARTIPAEQEQMKWALTYAATKLHTEMEAWKYYREQKPNYAFNVVLPGFVMGPVANPAPGYYNTQGWMNDFFNGTVTNVTENAFNPSTWVTDTRDCAAIHIAALLSTEVSGERLWACSQVFTANEILAIWREAYPDRKFREDFNYPEMPKVELLGREKSTQLLKELEGRDWMSLKDISLDNVAQVAKN
ncbi:hypothetical protein BKA62DRAFT_320 [Auriculariales sp. MPI-PUGE-AT-0066]|nr:hypothetical protein BKA62DRAFT_320 [Auriculariales sp. MPI-PUGE-AT-0066]